MKYYNEHPVLVSPILKKHKNNRRTVIVNQLFGESLVPFYGDKGHGGIDMKTKGVIKYIFHNVKGFVRLKRNKSEIEGTIPIQAAHEGTVTFAGEDSGGGKFVKVISNEVQIGGRKAKIETLYYHLSWYRVKKGQVIRQGHIVGYAGNTGKYTTGAHLHFAVKIHWKVGRSFKPSDDYTNPIPFLTDGTVYQKGTFRPRYFQFGKEILKHEII